ncbi:uncharacterized protein LOC110837334 [Zootermopsis nevadensis]|uniref:Protein FAM207A n=1 Tax=Zootermopsis nevadensis TaxID=136037 RepID=A0A067QNQ2_ZOONE|nr:uncharacterized protein LOC110837334 [Zootermopsis nevadensis]KDR11159.1 hypothetical protein L798_14941 [Zootermopsis nevadensis]
MGKLRRERHKYHLSRAKSTNGASVTPTENNEASKGESPESSALLPVPENLFAGVDISFDSLKQSLKDPDVRSVISKKSLSGGSLKSKKEKKKLRHEVFLKKLQATYEIRKSGKKRRRSNKSPREVENAARSDKLPSRHLSDKLPSLDLNIELAQKTSSSKEKSAAKHRSIPKAKRRNNVMLQDISLFKRLLANDGFKADPVTSVSSHVRSKVYEEFMSEA